MVHSQIRRARSNVGWIARGWSVICCARNWLDTFPRSRTQVANGTNLVSRFWNCSSRSDVGNSHRNGLYNSNHIHGVLVVGGRSCGLSKWLVGGCTVCWLLGRSRAPRVACAITWYSTGGQCRSYGHESGIRCSVPVRTSAGCS